MNLLHSDVKHGFVINFREKPDFEIAELEQKVIAIIESDIPIKQTGEDTIRIGEAEIPCTGTRTHVQRTGLIHNFRLWKNWKYNAIKEQYLLVGMVGKDEIAGLESSMTLDGIDQTEEERTADG